MPTLFADRYQLLERLGGGGHGEVFRAIDTHRQMEVALKLLTHPSSQPVHAYWEASLLTSLRSDNVLEVYDAGTAGDVPYLATAMAAGGTTEDQIVAAPFGIRPDFAVLWLRQALIGLRTCHSRGLLHRDIKPSNIFLQRNDWALIGDFGMARLVGSDGLAPAAGTPVTKAPELFRTGMMDARSDLYSLGVTGYLLLAGDWPFWADDEVELAQDILAARSTPLQLAAPHVSRRLAQRISKAMAPDPRSRYADAEAMLGALSVPGLVENIWQRSAAPHAGHSACWEELRRSGGQLREVCVEPSQRQRSDIVVRFTRSGKRVPGMSDPGVVQAGLARRLAALFRRL